MGGIGAWRKLAPDDNSTDEQIKRRQYAWRDAHDQTVRFWTALTTRAIKAVNDPCNPVKFQTPGWRHLSFKSDGVFLRMILPSGRAIAYPLPAVKTGSDGKPAVVFMDSTQGRWTECRNGEGAYGGTWLENAVQAVARDLFAAAMLPLEAAGYRIVLHVHDEIVCEVPEGFGSTDEFLKILTTPPPWAAGLPLAAKVRNGPRFCKSQSKPVEPEPISEAAVESAKQKEEAPPWEDQHREQRAFNDYPSGERMFGSTAAEYIYLDQNKQPYLKVRRTSAKQFPQFHLENGRWVKGAPKGPHIPYRLPELIAAAPDVSVWCCEGEKDSDNTAALGLVATTNSGGAGKWWPELNQWFKGKQCVYIPEDNDDTGRAHARLVAENLHGIVPDVRIVSFPELPEKGDVSDWLDQGHTKQELLDRAMATPKYEPPKNQLQSTRASNVRMLGLNWLWPGRFAIGKLGLIAGCRMRAKGC